MENPPYVPYQAYKSKRHNRGHSNPQVIPNASPPPVQPRPVSTLTNGQTYSEPLVPHGTDEVADVEKRSFAMLNGRNPLQRPVSMIDTLTHLKQEPPLPEPVKANAETVIVVEKAPEKPLPPPVVIPPAPVAITPASPVREARPASVSPPPVSTPPVSASPLPSTPSSSHTSSPKANGKVIAQPASPAAGPSTLSPASAERSLPSAKRTSTFRHIPLRSPAKSSMSPSPLRPSSMHIPKSTSFLASPQPAERTLHEPTSGLSSAVSSPGMTAQDRALPPIPAFELHSQRSPSMPPIHAPSPTAIAPAHSPNVTAPPPRSSSLMTPPAYDGMPVSSHPGSQSPSPALTPSASTSSAAVQPTPTSRTRTPVRSPAPYRPGFQPKGVYNIRTDEFVAARNHSRDVGRIERTRLERRLEKLINLHFPPPGQRKQEAPEERPVPQNRRASSFWDIDLSDLKNRSAGDLWRGVVQSQASQGGKNDVRAAEQKITPWESDASVSQCPMCTASFHPLTNRKHHCRLCGRIICSLPVKYPQRPETCSLLFVVDQTTGRIEEVGEGVDYGVRRRSVAPPGKPQKRGELNEEEKFLKGVRICRDCRPVLLRQQYRQEMTTIPLFSRLYDAFIVLEKEIEDELPLFQEIIVNLSREERPTPEAAAARKRLLEAFAQYDALAKRIRKLPCAPGSSQDRIQAAIISRANIFLQKHMFPLQSLPKPKKAANAAAQSAPPAEDQIIDPDSEVARILQPLLEQEALLETFVEEAKAHRKFEDVKTLKNNLKEIRGEIERILVNAEEQAPSQQGRTRTSSA